MALPLHLREILDSHPIVSITQDNHRVHEAVRPTKRRSASYGGLPSKCCNDWAPKPPARNSLVSMMMHSTRSKSAPRAASPTSCRWNSSGSSSPALLSRKSSPIGDRAPKLLQRRGHMVADSKAASSSPDVLRMPLRS
uniref:Uncharacterized protein n=1 Tax=Entomoneis paludosa TaxID=265537 RepID=A0A7S2Y984_9STRA|mmetsp:Transcript_23040/g.48049  ORF Transcript_23040/g.48049 Transcript_23040/m.48049 type:complete len:138 (+) Transcript_23040:38-451(+)|eukprot:CAMPEP_0172456616 /NCGR_PEP_ID=MMETSP1065-20121228/16640_1 /TAXON_ID=265537 /ORGANISM="Amphiprora paludosa, Strain CCMP125" /LENGTH=137 /DNA_ID=CAMNT_0013209749 /DNA_START=20 /DNA_END=433 /DNA_ORIENTATION=-